MQICQIVETLDQICPLDLCDEWDNSGTQIEFSQVKVRKVLVALEITDAVIDEAVKNKVQLIVTHHPLIFGRISDIRDDDPIGRYITKLISHKISVYSSHTNFDRMTGGNNDYLGELLGFKDVRSADLLRFAKLDKPISIDKFVKTIGSKLQINKDKLRIIGYQDNRETAVETVAWCTGSGAEFIREAKSLGADLYLTGDIKYHDARMAAELGIPCVDIGHFGSEKIFAPNMATHIARALEWSTDIPEVIISDMDIDPFYNL